MKKVKNWDGKPVAAYQDADLAELDGVFAEAGRLWVKSSTGLRTAMSSRAFGF